MWGQANPEVVATIPLGFPFLYSLSPPLGSTVYKMQMDQSGKGWYLVTCIIGLLYIHLNGCRLRVLIDSCKLYNNRLYCACHSHNSVCYNQMYVGIEYLWIPDTTERLYFYFSISCIGEGNGNPLQCSGLENPRDRGAWWAAVYGVAQSRTWLKRFSSSSNRLLGA